MILARTMIILATIAKKWVFVTCAILQGSMKTICTGLTVFYCQCFLFMWSLKEMKEHFQRTTIHFSRVKTKHRSCHTNRSLCTTNLLGQCISIYPFRVLSMFLYGLASFFVRDFASFFSTSPFSFDLGNNYHLFI